MRNKALLRDPLVRELWARRSGDKSPLWSQRYSAFTLETRLVMLETGVATSVAVPPGISGSKADVVVEDEAAGTRPPPD